MTFKRDPSGDPPRRLSPSELAEEVARRLKSGGSDRGAHRRRPRFDIVTASRIALALGVVLLAIGAVFAVSWISRLAGFETTGTVVTETAVYGCPGEAEIGVLFSGEIVELVGRSTDGAWFAVRDGRGPGNVVYAPADRIDPAGDFEQLATRPCDPREANEVAAVAITQEADAGTVTTTTITASGTSIPGIGTTTGPAGTNGGRPPRRGTSSPGTTTTITPTQPGSTAPSPTSPPGTPTTQPPTTAPATTQPPATGPTTSQPATTTTTQASTTTTQGTTTTTTTVSTTTTTPSSTTTTTSSTTTTSQP